MPGLHHTFAALLLLAAAESSHTPFLSLLRRSLTGETVPAYVKGQAEAKAKFPVIGLTMLDTEALDALERHIKAVATDAVPGHFLEAGVWRGGSCIYAAALLRSYEPGNRAFNRTVFVVDSFDGLPLASTQADNHGWWQDGELRVTEEQVREGFERNLPGILSPSSLGDGGGRGPHVRFVRGFVRQTLPELNATLPPPSGDGRGGDIAILRIDVDMYEGYIDTLFHLAHRVPAGGFFIMDDYSCIPSAKKAVDDWRRWHGLTEPLVLHGGCSASWRAAKRLTNPDLSKYDDFNAGRAPVDDQFALAIDFYGDQGQGILESIELRQAAGESMQSAIKRFCAHAVPRDVYWSAGQYEECADLVAIRVAEVRKKREGTSHNRIGDTSTI
jgi:hypothetical protein